MTEAKLASYHPEKPAFYPEKPAKIGYSIAHTGY
jgi:hypothetical protein